MPNFFKFEIIFALSIFEIFVASKVFAFTVHCSMPRQALVRKILSPHDQVEDVAVVCSARFWDCGHNGSLWINPSAVINVLSVPGNINTTIQTPDGEVVPITVSWSGCFL